jgi:hypothetical protein
MRTLWLFLLVPLSCSVPAGTWEPECVASGRLHACGPGPRSCNTMLARDGWDVTFDPPADAPYTVDIVADGEETSFRCEEVVQDGTTYYSPEGDAFLWGCDLDGFEGGPRGDVLVVTVTVDGHEPVTTTVEPCWDISEPNGRCCGFVYRATSTLPAYAD